MNQMKIQVVLRNKNNQKLKIKEETPKIHPLREQIHKHKITENQIQYQEER